MRRREFIAGLVGAAWPVLVLAQQSDRVRRIGVLSSFAEDDAQAQARVAALRQGMRERGWNEGRNLQIDFCWAGPRRRTHKLLRRGTDRLGTRRDAWHRFRQHSGIKAGDTCHTDRIRGYRRSGRPRLCRELGAAGRQHYGLYRAGVLAWRKVGRASQTGCPKRDPGDLYYPPRNRTVLPAVA